ncbi:hypothetical protein PGT21_012791 [Puccinia graminis f. sp. tritici]|uniref:Uncharacterized protein n=1 Tax=Puccinia graminis f. sp. tritici TaxID=56615 RepID=A0A5B0MER5_PUCGR|nr:hypothetical protein PGT21_012791 [Puccinia graminis f. sp. tritici]
MELLESEREELKFERVLLNSDKELLDGGNAVSNTSSSTPSSEISKTKSTPLLGLSSHSLSTIIYLLNNSSLHLHPTTFLHFPLSLHSLPHLPTCSLPSATISIHVNPNSASSHPYSANSISRNTHLATANLCLLFVLV